MSNLQVKAPFIPESVDTPLDGRSRIAALADVESIELPYVGMKFFCLETGLEYRVLSLKSKQIGAATVANAAIDTYAAIPDGGGTGMTEAERARLLPDPDAVPTDYNGNPLVFTTGIETVDEDTVLLLHLDGSAADSSPSAHAMIAQSGIAYGVGVFGSAAIFATGSPAYISCANHADFNFAAKTAWTVDFWVSPAGTSGYRAILAKRSGSNPTSYQFGLDSGGSNRVYLFEGSNIYSSTAELPAGIFSHVAFTYDAGTLKIWINGLLDSTHTGVSLTEVNVPLEIGYHLSSVTEQFTGLLDELRLSTVVRWTENFTPPTSPHGTIGKGFAVSENPIPQLPDPASVPSSRDGNPLIFKLPDLSEFVDADTVFCLLPAFGLADVSTNPATITNGGASIADAAIQFGSSYFDVIGCDKLNFGAGDYTIEFWLDSGSQTNSLNNLLVAGNAWGTGATVLAERNDKMYIGAYPSNPLIHAEASGPSGIYHMALVRNAGTTNLFIAGAIQGTGTESDAAATGAMFGQYMRVGKDRWNSGDYWTGKVYGIRISNVARYTTAFTPPAQPPELSDAGYVVSGNPLLSKDDTGRYRYSGQLKPVSRSVAVSGSQTVVLDAAQFSRWILTGSGTATLDLESWEDGDKGELVIDTGAVTPVIPADWVTLGADITTTPGLYVLEIAQVNSTIFYAIRYPNSSGGSSNETPGGTVYSGTVGSGAYVADYSSGDVHTVSSPSDASAYTVSTANIPIGCALVLRIDNATGSVVTCGGNTVIEAADVGAFLLTFANITGLTKLVSKLTEA